MDKIEKQLVIRATKMGIPINVTLELTPLCNMNCKMCFIRLSHEEMSGHLKSVDEWKGIIDQLVDAGTLFVLLTGGEPLLYPGFKELYLMLLQKGIIVTVNTNGTLIDEEMADFFNEYRPRRLNITLYGASDETYSKICHNNHGFSDVMKALKLLKARNVDVKLNGTIVPDNYQEMEQLQSIAAELGMPIEMATYIYPGYRERSYGFNQASRLSPVAAGNAYIKECMARMDDFDGYVDTILNDLELFQGRPDNLVAEGMLCRGGRTSAWINWQGLMSPCIFMNQVSVDVFDYGFSKSWELIKAKTREIHLPKECANCDLRPACSICPAKCLLETGSFDKVPAYVCKYSDTIVKLMRKSHSR